MNEKRDDFVGFVSDRQKDKTENFLENMEIGTSIEKLKSQLPSSISIKEGELAKAMNDIFSNPEKINNLEEIVDQMQKDGIGQSEMVNILNSHEVADGVLVALGKHLRKIALVIGSTAMTSTAIAIDMTAEEAASRAANFDFDFNLEWADNIGGIGVIALILLVFIMTSRGRSGYAVRTSNPIKDNYNTTKKKAIENGIIPEYNDDQRAQSDIDHIVQKNIDVADNQLVYELADTLSANQVVNIGDIDPADTTGFMKKLVRKVDAIWSPENEQEELILMARTLDQVAVQNGMEALTDNQKVLVGQWRRQAEYSGRVAKEMQKREPNTPSSWS